ncbi:MAG: preprotein translocase subunit SecG [Clostridia bacterium]|nr:preprotein translocase subunit SecG [Clostridia bacterium]
MPVIRTILTVIYFIIAFIVTILAFMQSKEDEGLSSTLTGSSTSNFYEKNKTRTKTGKLKKWTIILSVIFAVLTIVLGILYMMK